MESAGSFAQRLDLVRDRIAAACARCGRDPAEVTLIAVSKTFDADVIRAAVATGQLVFGENRVQEALAKVDELAAEHPDLQWHLIGSLQKNKARHVVGRFSLIHSVDSISLANELGRRALAADVEQRVLVQLNLSGEETKHGAAEAELDELLPAVASQPGLDLVGLMTIPPPVDRPEDSRRWFVRLRELRDTWSDRLDRPFPELSMGMTGDFEVAIEEGATLVRVGRALFGPR